MKKIYVVCPGGLTTGGAELLHQLVHQLRTLGAECYISYLPQNKTQSIPNQYRKYNIVSQKYKDEENTLIIFPEICTRYSKKIKKSESAIWWLSVDNYYRFPQNNTISNPLTHIKNNKFYDFIRYANAALRNRSISSMKRMVHFTQSMYAKEFLLNKGIASKMLGDYLSSEHFLPADTKNIKENIIVYNPKKGVHITNELIKIMPEYNFIPIQKLTAKGVADLLKRAKIYIDFGNHPGKDRPPREAVMAECCVILGKSGAAKNTADYPISEKYKLSTSDENFHIEFKNLVEDILIKFDTKNMDFYDWRNFIKLERYEFEKQCEEIFKQYC